MHDPYTLIFALRLPLLGYVFELWHKNPPGGDCGWSYPFLNQKERDRIEHIVRSNLYLSPETWGNRTAPPPEVCFLWMFSLVAWNVFRCPFRGKIVDAALGFWLETITTDTPHDYQDAFAALRIVGHQPTEKEIGLFEPIARTIKRVIRPWWRHPRWHFWHWRPSFPIFRRLFRKRPKARMDVAP